MALECLPATNITTQEATISGETSTPIPVNQFLRMAYSNTMGGPYTSTGPNNPGTNTAGQSVSFTATDLSSQASVGATYYYVIQHLDTDGMAIIDESAECEFTTLPYNPRCNVLSSDDSSITIEICADFVAPDQELQAVWGDNPGGPYPNVGAFVPGTYVDDQCQIFDIPVPPCEIRYWKARVTPVPAEYVVDWTYAHMNRSGVDETAELGLGSQADWIAAGGEVGSAGFNGLTVVDTHVATGASQGMWTLRSGTDFPVPTGVNLLHLGFRGSGGAFPTSGNWLDSCSIVLRQVFPGTFTVGEQLINGGFEAPVKLIPNDWEYIPETMVPGWETSDTTGPQNPANPTAWGGPVINGPIEYFNQAAAGFPAHSGVQFAELNAENPSELYQVVSLAVGTVDSPLECPASAFLIECTAATNIECTTATINGQYCGVQEDYWVALEFAPTALGPWTERSPLIQSFGPLEAITNFSYNLNTDPNQVVFYRVVILNQNQELIATSDPVCSFTTANCVLYCGMYFSPDDCFEVDMGNGETYFYCYQF